MSKLKVLLFCFACIMFSGCLIILGLAWLIHGDKSYWETVQKYSQDFLAIVALILGVFGIAFTTTCIYALITEPSSDF